jgi:hypothetical protein
MRNILAIIGAIVVVLLVISFISSGARPFRGSTRSPAA